MKKQKEKKVDSSVPVVSDPVTESATKQPNPRAPRLTAFNVHYYRANNPDVVQKIGDDAGALFMHYLTNGINEGRRPIPFYASDAEFDCHEYIHRYPDLKGMKWGDGKHYNCDTAETHYYTEGRNQGLIARYVP